MKKIFWAIQNLNGIGGTEMVSVQLMNLLCHDYEVHLICTSEIQGDVSYKIDPAITVHSLKIPAEVGRFDQYWAAYKKTKNHKGKRRLLKETLSAYLFHRGKRRKLIESWMDEDSLYIGSALDSYLLAPKHRHVWFHFHFGAGQYLNPMMQTIFRFCTKPEKIIFLAQATIKNVAPKKKKDAAKFTYIYNPAKFPSKKRIAFHGGEILFIGRFTEQKDPMLALQIAKLLHEEGFHFHLQMYGEGHLEQAMRDFVASNGLKEVDIATGHTTSPEDYFSSDLLLCTSAWEGSCLVKAEANACSRPVVSAHWEGPIDEVFDPKTDGWVMPNRDPKPFADTLKHLLSNPEELMQAQKKAYEGSLRFGEEAIKKQWERLIG